MSLPYFPMYPKDFEADTSQLSLAEDGAYNRLLRLCWRTPGCTMPDDLDWIFWKARAVLDSDREAVKRVLDEYFTRKGGRIFNPRLLEEWEAASEAHGKRVEAGSRGGSAKALKSNKTRSSNATEGLELGSSNQNQNQNHREVSANAATSSAQPPPKDWDADRLLDAILTAVGVTGGRLPTHWMPPASTMHCWRWVTELGLKPELIVDAARQSRSNYDEPPNGPKALDNTMRRIASEQSAPKFTPSQQRPSKPDERDDKRAFLTKVARGAA